MTGVGALDPAAAERLIQAEARPLATERIGRDAAHGRVLAEPVRADRDFPPAARSAMDGFALRAADATAPGAVLELIGEVRAGQASGAVHVGAGQAARIFTGALLPPGADAVAMVERTRPARGGAAVELLEAARPGQHVRRRAEELAAGAVVLEAGVRIGAPELAALCSVGAASVEVYRAPTVAVLATGDEIVEPDRPVVPHQVRNSNAHALVACLREAGAAARYLGIAGDRREELRSRLEAGASADALLITGGVSVGEYDLVAAELTALGARTVLHRVAIKPGQPLLVARRGACLIFGLPGNPVSTFAMFVVFVAPALRRMMGLRHFGNVEQAAILDAPLDAAAGRKTYHLARLAAAPDGLRARPIAAAGSGDVLALARANGFVITAAAGARLMAGDAVPALVWGAIDPPAAPGPEPGRRTP